MTRSRKKTNSGQDYNNARQVAEASKPFVFTHNGETFELPPIEKGVESVKAGAVIDAVMIDDELADVRLGISTLQESGVSDEAMQALRDKPMKEFSTILADWMRSYGVEVGKSGR